MAHDHGQGHDHHHHEPPADYSTAFAIGVALNTIFVIVEVIFGILAGSMALVADAGHNASDVLGLLLAWGAVYLSKRTPSPRRTYGLRRSSILAALGNAVFLLISIGGIAWESIGRFAHPEPVAGRTVMIVAGIGIVVNAATAILFMSGRKRDVNIEGAFIHMAADAAVSLGVLIAGAIIAFTGWHLIDPIVSLLIVVTIAWSTWGLLKKSVNLAMDAVPEGIDPVAVKSHLAALPGVAEVHDLHIWGMSTTEAAMTVHLVKPSLEDEDSFLAKLADDLHHQFGIEHLTVQVERGTGAACKLAPENVV